jgi:hypothetical protein
LRDNSKDFTEHETGMKHSNTESKQKVVGKFSNSKDSSSSSNKIKNWKNPNEEEQESSSSRHYKDDEIDHEDFKF